MKNSANTRGYRQRDLQVRMDSNVSGLMWPALLLLMGLLAVCVSTVWLHSSADRYNRRLQEARREFAMRSKELENMTLEQVSYTSGRYIFHQVERLNLQLHPPYPGQVRRLVASVDRDRVLRDSLAQR